MEGKIATRNAFPHSLVVSYPSSLLDSTPVGLFYMLYHRSDGSSPKPHYDDEYRLLCQKLHKFARTDPFSVSHALVEVGPRSTGYRFTDFPGIQDSWTRQSLFPLSEIICLMKQGEWDFSWHESQLDDVCSLRWRPWDNRITVVRYHVFFWVTQTVHHIQKCLDAKMALLNVFLDFGALRLRPGDDHCVIKALRSTIFQGAETINLLMQSDYYGTGNPPWIRHRSRKVIMARKCMLRNRREDILSVHGWKQCKKSADIAPTTPLLGGICIHAATKAQIRKHGSGLRTSPTQEGAGNPKKPMMKKAGKLKKTGSRFACWRPLWMKAMMARTTLRFQLMISPRAPAISSGSRKDVFTSWRVGKSIGPQATISGTTTRGIGVNSTLV
ncbi:hypothetical protein B0T19DRAFT_199696 [Cercophora scortea]|uniref:Uncharacterized protein n=1 Tax=Cercophora scortea TaxID=314031 RepID=A0AAE0IDV7_9PEZI|nr:hypothetical protein B0T19DRAFT_199696 [Cercophora scortea]